MLNKAKKETEELLSKVIFKFHGNKGVTALLWVLCFRNLSDYNLKWGNVIKTTI